MNTSEKVAKLLLNLQAITLNPKKPYKYSSGILSPVYTDCRILMSYHKERRYIRNLYVDVIKSAGDFDLIAATATAGIPYAAWIADKMKLPMVYVLGNAKDHGKGNQIEGKVQKGHKTAVIEDLISTGESSVGTVKAIREAGGKAKHVFAIITYEMARSRENFKANKIKPVYLTTFSDVISQAVKLRIIRQDERKMVLDWIKDPNSWEAKMGFTK